MAQSSLPIPCQDVQTRNTGTALTSDCQGLTVGDMTVFKPREVVRRSWLWRDGDGQPWLLIFDFTMIAGRVECCGMELRSFLRDEVDATAEYPEGAYPDAVYDAWWEGEPTTTVEMINEHYLRKHLDGLPPLIEHDSPGVSANAAASPEMSHPRPLRATILRQLRLADEVTRARRQQWPYESTPPWSIVDAGDQAVAAWERDREAMWDPKRRQGGRVAKYSREELERVARIYTTADKNGDPPTKAVADQIEGLNRIQAAKLVMKCRRAGLIEPVSNRQRPTRRRSNHDQEGSHADQDH